MSKCHIIGNHMSRLNYNESHLLQDAEALFHISILSAVKIPVNLNVSYLPLLGTYATGTKI